MSVLCEPWGLRPLFPIDLTVSRPIISLLLNNIFQYLSMLCPCKSELDYQNCCEPYHLGKSFPETPEQLMRSRYSAFALKIIPYLVDTLSASKRTVNLSSELTEFATSVDFKHLEILNAPVPDKDSGYGFVEFKAWYKAEDGNYHWMQENSRFEYIDIRWYYLDGNLAGNPKPIKIGRNDPCVCQSGKKYKKCCGKSD